MAGNFIEHHPTGYGGIEVWGPAPQGNPHDLIAILAGEVGQASVFGTHNNNKGLSRRDLHNTLPPLSGQAHNGVARLLQLLQGAIEVHHPRHGQVLQGAGSHLGHTAGEAGVAPLGRHQPMASKGLHTAGNRPQVVGIGDAVNRHQQG